MIAVDALGRDESFDPKSDPVVRVEAGRLRDRLGSFYQQEGESDSLCISLPKGAYVPEFSERQPAALRTGVLRVSILPPEHASFESFTISPNGRKLAFTTFVNGKLTLWIRSLDSLETRCLAGTDFASWPFWSPDSRSVGFFTPSKLKAIDASGGPAWDVADVVVGRGGAWSPQGSILFCPRPLGVLHQVPATGAARRNLSPYLIRRAPKWRMPFPDFYQTAGIFFIWRRVRGLENLLIPCCFAGWRTLSGSLECGCERGVCSDITGALRFHPFYP